ncbi:MAG: VCBS repeat-containing protein, partial [Acidimicrobiales bacterium]|nr:VCBS repeat-containing protein [Acidimicrobiales bacterium]
MVTAGRAAPSGGRAARAVAVVAGVALAATSLTVTAVAPPAAAQGAADPAPITFQTATRAATPAGMSDPSYYGMDVADVNGDGTPDAAAPVVFNVPGVGVRSVVHVQLGQGDGTFGAPTFEADLPVTGGPGPGSIYYGMRVVFGSFTGDASLDLVATHVGSAAVFVFEGNGDGTFDVPTQVPLTFFPSSLRAGDLDGDGTDDLVAGWAWGTPGPVRLAVLTSTAPGAWTTQEIDPGATMADIAIGDVDGV